MTDNELKGIREHMERCYTGLNDSAFDDVVCLIAHIDHLHAENEQMAKTISEAADKIREIGKEATEYHAQLERYTTAQAEGRLKWMPDTGIGDLSDGYHTFNELYHHRAVLFSVICNLYLSLSWKSKKHHDGTMFDGMFIVGINTPYGQATYHYDIEPYWDYFRCSERDFAPEWDGHTPEMAIERLLKFGNPTYAREAAEAALAEKEETK